MYVYVRELLSWECYVVDQATDIFGVPLRSISTLNTVLLCVCVVVAWVGDSSDGSRLS